MTIKNLLSLPLLAMVSCSTSPSAARPAAPLEAEALAAASTLAADPEECATPQPDTASNALHLLAVARGEPDARHFCFTVAGVQFAVTNVGEGVAWPINGRDDRRYFTLRLDESYVIDAIRYHDAGDRLYIAYEASLGGYGAGYLVAFDSQELRPVWSNPLPLSMNVGPALFHPNRASLYVTGADMVGKVSLRTGEFHWKHIFFNDDLLGVRAHFHAFELPRLDQGEVRFKELHSRAPAETLVVEDRTGVVVAPDKFLQRQPTCSGRRSFCGWP